MWDEHVDELMLTRSSSVVENKSSVERPSVILDSSWLLIDAESLSSVAKNTPLITPGASGSLKLLSIIVYF